MKLSILCIIGLVGIGLGGFLIDPSFETIAKSGPGTPIGIGLVVIGCSCFWECMTTASMKGTRIR